MSRTSEGELMTDGNVRMGVTIGSAAEVFIFFLDVFGVSSSDDLPAFFSFFADFSAPFFFFFSAFDG